MNSPPHSANADNPSTPPQTETYTVNVDGRNFSVIVGSHSAVLNIQPTASAPHAALIASSGATVESPMAGNILKILVDVGSIVAEGDVVVIMEAMKMETEIRSKTTGIVSTIYVKEGSAVAGGDVLISL